MADLGIARLGKEAGIGGTLTRADLADIVHRKLGLSRAESAELVERVLHHMCHALSEGPEREDLRLRQLHPARQGRARRPQSQDRRRSADRAAPGDDLPRQPDHARPDRELGECDGDRPKRHPDAFRTIGELSQELGVAQHILRYWETKFPQLKPLQRAGNRRYYRPADVALARTIHRLLNSDGYTVRGVQKLLREQGTAGGRRLRSSRRDARLAARAAGSRPSASRHRCRPADRAAQPAGDALDRLVQLARPQDQLRRSCRCRASTSRQSVDVGSSISASAPVGYLPRPRRAARDRRRRRAEQQLLAAPDCARPASGVSNLSRNAPDELEQRLGRRHGRCARRTRLEALAEALLDPLQRFRARAAPGWPAPGRSAGPRSRISWPDAPCAASRPRSFSGRSKSPSAESSQLRLGVAQQGQASSLRPPPSGRRRASVPASSRDPLDRHVERHAPDRHARRERRSAAATASPPTG